MTDSHALRTEQGSVYLEPNIQGQLNDVVTYDALIHDVHPLKIGSLRIRLKELLLYG